MGKWVTVAILADNLRHIAFCVGFHFQYPLATAMLTELLALVGFTDFLVLDRLVDLHSVSLLSWICIVVIVLVMGLSIWYVMNLVTCIFQSPYVGGRSGPQIF